MHPQFNSRQHYVTFVVAEVAPKQIFLQVSSVFPTKIITPMLYTTVSQPL